MSVCVAARRCALANADRPGGGLIGRWRHYGGSGKRGHVRSLSNGRHPPIHPAHPQPRHSPVSPTATPSASPPTPNSDRLASSHPLTPRLSPHPASRSHTHTHTPRCYYHHHRYYHYHYHHHAPNPYTRHAKLWHVYRYVSLCTSTYMDVAVYTRGARIPAALSPVHSCISE